MTYKQYDLWTANIEIHDDFITDKILYDQLIKESSISKTIDGQNVLGLTTSQKQIYDLVTIVVVSYCMRNNIDYSNLTFTELQKGSLHKYDQTMVSNHLYEPHDDRVEGSFLTALYYIDSSYDEYSSTWVGGELTIYKNLTFAEYPNNAINILPKQNRLVVFPGFNVHRVKPYFGDKPRTSLVFGWSVNDQPQTEPLTV